jgi:hypothetical protein
MNPSSKLGFLEPIARFFHIAAVNTMARIGGSNFVKSAKGSGAHRKMDPEPVRAALRFARILQKPAIFES